MVRAFVAGSAVACWLTATAQAGQCQWKFSVNNQTGNDIKVEQVSTRTGAWWLMQWHSTQEIDAGDKEQLSQLVGTNTNPGYSFTSNTACNPNKKIDFKVRFYCVDLGNERNYHRKALNKVRDGVHTVKITTCSDYTS